MKARGKLRSRSHFYLGRFHDTSRIYLRKTFSNIFVTLTDLFNRTIVCRTSGNSGVEGSKRRKCVPYAIENIVKELYPYLKVYNITKIQLVLKLKVNRFCYTLFRELAYYGIKVVKFKVRRSTAFNGVRGRKLRRT